MEMSKLVRYLVILLLVLCAPTGVKSADLSSLPPTEAGLTVGLGNSDIKEGKYEPYLLVFHLGADLKQYLSCLNGHKGKLSIFIEPQLNPVLNLSEYEFGVGIGLKYMYPLNDKLSLYIMLSVGPHYISVETEDQARGFVFADTVGAGLYYFFDRNAGFNIGYRFRHLSNGGLEYPNFGINSNFGTIGYFYFF
jgi:hypothetical protein